jgi:hypothetical protein
MVKITRVRDPFEFADPEGEIAFTWLGLAWLGLVWGWVGDACFEKV